MGDNHSLSEKVFHKLQEDILSGKYAVDEELKEKTIGDELGVSRTPVREALRQLENEGIVEYTRNVGCSVRTFSFWDSYEVYLLRTNYEAVSVRFLNGKIPGETIQKMEEILERMRKIPTEEFESVFEYDNCFHEQLVLMSGLPRLAKAWKELYYGNLLAGYELVNEKEKILANQYDNHIAILKACKEGNPEKICDEVKKHYWKTIFCMMQEQKPQNATAALTGASNDSFYDKNRGRTKEARLHKLTTILTVLFFVLILFIDIVMPLITK